MKNKVIIIGLMFFLIIANCITVFADSNSVTLQSEKTQVNAGELLKVKIHVTAPEGINGLITTYNYDSEKLELIEQNVIDSDFVDLRGATPNEIALMFNPENPSQFVETTETDIYELTFRVKENAKDSAKISLTETKLNTLSLANSEHTIEEQELTIKIINEDSETNWPIIIVAVIIVMVLFGLIFKRKK